MALLTPSIKDCGQFTLNIFFYIIYVYFGRKATGDQLENWTPERLQYWQYLRADFEHLFMKLFKSHSNFDFPKMHDISHEQLQIERFGSLRNLDEMNFEACNQVLKTQVRHMNGRNLEEMMAIRVQLILHNNVGDETSFAPNCIA